MSTTPPLPLSELVDISVTVSAAAATANGFNQGLIVGSSAVIPTYGTNPRLRQYASTTAMLSDGFASNDPEVIAAGLYFEAPTPPGYVWIGRQDLTAISTLIPHTGNAGTGFAVGDVVAITQVGGSHGQAVVTGVASGVVTSLAASIVGGQGTGYSVATGLVATAVTGSGTGLEVDITAIGESLLQASEACRLASSAWYGLMVCGPVDADNLAIAAWADSLWQNTRYYGWSNDAAIPNGTAGNLFLQMKTAKYRAMMIYSTTQGGLWPNNIYAAAALMGLEMGLNTGLAGSFFTSAYKTLPGIAPEPLTPTQYNNVTGNGTGTFYGNVYANFAPYQFLQPGYLCSGAPGYLWLYLAMLVANIQINELNVLGSQPAISQTNAGEHLLLQAANDACQLLTNIGFISPGTWEGTEINIIGVTLKDGQALPLGYLNQAQPYSQQSAGDRAAGKAMPIYCAITTAGAVQSLLVGIYTQL
jgi:hypothetical protein